MEARFVDESTLQTMEKYHNMVTKKGRNSIENLKCNADRIAACEQPSSYRSWTKIGARLVTRY